MQIENEWGSQKEEFFKKLRTLGLSTQNQYNVIFTIYGTGGSYHSPNTIVVNLNRGENVCRTIFHEIIHLTIEPLIQKFKIGHWTKERLVNLIANKFFPNNITMQRDPENAGKISEIFEKHFPNIEHVIDGVSKM